MRTAGPLGAHEAGVDDACGLAGRRVGAGACVGEDETLEALPMAACEGEGDVAAHGESREGDALEAEQVEQIQHRVGVELEARLRAR